MTEISSRAVVRAAQLLAAAVKEPSAAERAEASRLSGMVDDERGKAFTLEMVDRVFRSHHPIQQARRFRELLQKFGAPAYLTPVQRGLMKVAGLASRWLPGVVMPAVARQLRKDSARVILAGEKGPLRRYLEVRTRRGTRVNLNQLGEAVLGEEEANHRLEAILELLAQPEVNYVSVKISAIFSQINLVDWEGTLEAVQQRLRRLYRAALPGNKFVNLDMEEYRDLELTLAAIQRTLNEPEFFGLRAGIVLQAYLPDSWKAQQELTKWARMRVVGGGAPAKLRLVKGANLAMEQVDAELHGWNAAPYASKTETDANFRRMLEFGCRPENARAVRLGVASHNLFDIALALEMRQQPGLSPLVELEMLEGMANPQARVVQEEAGGLLVYAPIVKRADFHSAMAYLVRRLDENTSPENFLRDLFALEPGSDAWHRQEQRFLTGWEMRHRVFAGSYRAQSKSVERGGFENAPDTDWTQASEREQLARSLTSFKLPVVPKVGVDGCEAVLQTAVAAQASWESLGFEERGEVLRSCAEEMSAGRFQAIAILVHEGRKAAAEADAEVSEAIDFARYYAGYRPSPRVQASALGTVVVTPPWNFPYAIPCGGVLAALMAGNSVIFKPAPETQATAWLLVQQLWRGGVPREVLQFFPCEDGAVGQALITDARTAAVILTGGYETAQLFQSWRPSLRLYAETSGKNSLIITAQADRDLAIKDLVKSAFGHAGQKCSAASLAILEAEVYDDPAFRRQLRDAAASLRVGDATSAASVVTPLIREASPALKRALTTLEEGEEWLLEPRQDLLNPCLWSPGIKLGVKPGSWFHKTECFGPVLGLMRAEDFNDAIRIQNDNDFGLTGGIHSLDDHEIAVWRKRTEVGNAYVNRSITGAIVQRQPFGGWKRSSIGPGAKAGGPNYVGLFLKFADARPVALNAVAANYGQAWGIHFAQEHDPSGLRCESNIFRYRPCRGVVLRLEREDATVLELARLAAMTSGVPLHVSLASQESEAQFIARLPVLAGKSEFLRTVEPPSDAALAAAHAAGLNWIDAPFVAEGRTELVRWVREQSLSQTLHRYGQMSAGASGANLEKVVPPSKSPVMVQVTA
ncbi:proline dehydrogenase family protein [Verrucomicrobium sp. BvORR034]|uniref:proline dehydrogenase family protein n=1 Tax=Verrucomicrobium sp. BvORR034 TaxID=1396418 RepID=UPI000678AC1D|nr:proline dehydrogenase family protein [Verrucomicrobium sp. BvORR034]